MNPESQLPRTVALALLIAILVALAARSARAAEPVGTRDSRAMAPADSVASRPLQPHMQVFIPAAVNEMLAALGGRGAPAARKTGFSRLVLPWDDRALAGLPAAYRVDATSRIAMQFRVPESPFATPGHLREVRPLPRWHVWALGKNQTRLVRLDR